MPQSFFLRYRAFLKRAQFSGTHVVPVIDAGGNEKERGRGGNPDERARVACLNELRKYWPFLCCRPDDDDNDERGERGKEGDRFSSYGN